MKRTILGMCVCFLLIGTAFPAVESVQKTGRDSTLQSAPLPIRAANWTETQKLLAADGTTGVEFGFSVALSGDTALIGEPYDDSYKGAAYVFTQTGDTWTQQAKLIALDSPHWSRFGDSVALSGDTALIGADLDNDNGNCSGSVYVFTRTGTTWTEQQKLLPSDGEAYDLFGYSVSLNGDTALIGAPGYDYPQINGSVYVFTRSGATWTQKTKLLAPDGALVDKFGNSVVLAGDTALIGAVWDDDNGYNSGSVYVFTRSGIIWTYQQKLLASDGTEYDEFGFSVSLSGNTALIGAVRDDDFKGSAYVFTRSGTTWSQQAKLIASDGAAVDCFGRRVSLDNDIALIGAPSDDDNGAQSGSAYIFEQPNQPPNPPTIHGPASGKVGQLYSYTFNSTDPDGDEVYYFVDWGDTASGWLGPFVSGVEVTLQHTWNRTDVYYILADAKDNSDHESTWSTFIVSILQRAFLIGFIHDVYDSSEYLTFDPTLVLAFWFSPFGFAKYSFGLMMISKNTSGFVGESFIIGMFDAAVVTNSSRSLSDHLQHRFSLPSGF